MATDARGQWLALNAAAAAPLFFALDASWWVTGGCALDLFLQRERPHHDLDIAVLRREQDAIRAHLAAWDLQALQDGALTPWPVGSRLAHDRSVVWGRTANYLPWQLSLLVENTEADEWVYAVDERVRLPLQALGLESADGRPYVRPEVVLLYQAGGTKGSSGDAVVTSISAKLSVPGRGWLRDALETAHPGHHWIGLLS